MNSWHMRPLFGLDVETTGTDPEKDRIITAAAIRYGGGRPNKVQSWIADPGVEVPAGATALHGYTTEALRASGRPAAQVVEEVTAAAAAAVTSGFPLVIMNAPFDLTMLDREARRHGVRPLFARCRPYVLDPRVLDRRVDRYRKGRRTLTDLCTHYVVKLDGAHEAMADATAACMVTWKIANRHRWLARTPLADLHAAQAQWAAEQQAGLREHFAQTPGKEHLAVTVRDGWPLVPRARTEVTSGA